MKKLIILLFILSSQSFFLKAGDKTPKTLWTIKDPFEKKEFIENNGQYDLGKRASTEDILFGARREGLHFYFTKNGIWVKYLAKLTRTEYEMEKFKEAMGEVENGEEKGEDNLVKYKWVEQFHHILFEGAGVKTTIAAEQKVSNVYNFCDKQKSNISASAYKKIVYKDLYPGIDMELVFPEDKEGFKYTFIVHPGANPALIKMSYPTHKSNLQLDAMGNLLIKSLFGNFTDHAPVSFLKDGKAVKSSFNLNANKVTFNIGKYPTSETLVIDPWTSTPIFAGGNTAYDVDWDVMGNCYAYGGTSPFQLVKFNAAGTQLWTYTNGFASTGGGFYYGDFAVNRLTGSAFLVDGFNGAGANAEKVNLVGGFAVASTSNANFQEMWRVVFSRCTNQVVIAGGGTTSPSFTGATFDTSLSAGSIQIANVINSPTGLHDMWGVINDAFGNAYFATAQTQVGTPGYDNFIFKVPMPALVPITYSVATTYSFVEVASVFSPGPGNGFNGMAMSNGNKNLYTYDSYNFHKWDSNTGLVTGNVSVNGASQNTMTYGGLAADECDHVFLGFNNTIRQYDGLTMTQVGTIPAGGTVYDCFLGDNNILYACGVGFVSAISVNLPPCTILNPTSQITNGTCANPVGSATLTVNGGTAPFNITWNTTPPQTGTVLSSVPSGTYIATITDNSCPPLTGYDTVVITSNAGVGLTSQVTNVSCFGGSNGAVTLTVSPTGTIVPTFTWSTGAQTQNVSNLAAGVYTLDIGTGGACNMTVTYTVTQPAPLTYTLNPGTISCFGDTTNISISVSGGTQFSASPSYSVTWNPPNATGFAVYGLGAGSYGGTIVDSMGCSSTFNQSLTQPPQIATSYTFTTGCLGTPVQFTDQSSGGPFTYNWIYGDGTAAGTVQNPQHTYAAAGNYTVSLIVTNSGGCKDTLDRTVTIEPPPQAAFSGDSLAGCPVHSVQFVDASTCTAGSISMWLWDFGNGQQAVGQFPPIAYFTNASATSPAVYSPALTVVSTKGCTSTVVKTSYITVYPDPVAGFWFASDDGTQIDVFNNNVHFYSTAVGATQWNWDLGDVFAMPSYSVNFTSIVNPVHQYANNDAFTYYVTQVVSNQWGCRDTAALAVPVRPIYTFYMPNSFSPNGDGINEYFKGTGVGINNSTYHMWVYDRWGNKVYETNDMEKPWDGRKNNKGEVILEDMYVWKVNFADIMGQNHEFHGVVSIIK